MIHFSPEQLSPEAVKYLERLQVSVNNKQPDREAKYLLADDLWRNRKNRKGDQVIWEEIEQKLAGSHPRPGLCQYCEYDRNSPTEHFFPKKHFPNRAFQWNNYLLICSICNSECKGDRFAVFVSVNGETTVFDLPITRGSYPPPPSEDPVLINPRTDDPQRFMLLDLMSGIFIPTPGTNTNEKARAKYTIETLQLSQNADLVRYRRKQFENYWRKLSEYVGVKNATSFPSLIAALSIGRQAIVIQTNAFETEKERILLALKNDILDDPFPTVWLEIKMQKDFFPGIANLFNQAPEALEW